MTLRKFTTALLFMLPILSTQAQDGKIGYTQIEYVLSSMPETNLMNTQLNLLTNTLQERMRIKEQYLQMKYQEYQELMEKGQLPLVQQDERQREIRKLEADYQEFMADAEQQIQFKREELMEPILMKLQAAIDKVATDLGFKYILNQSDSGGVSTVLFAPKENDITKVLLKELGIAAEGN